MSEIKFLAPPVSSGTVGALAWLLVGNTGVVDGTNFLGSLNDAALSFRVNSQKAGRIGRADLNTFLGYQSGNAISSGGQNTFIGYQSGLLVSTGQNLTFVGKGSGAASTDAVECTYIGNDAGGNTTGPKNTAVGHCAGVAQTSGIFNVMLGVNSGRHLFSAKPQAAINGNINIGVGAGDDSSAASDWNIFIGLQSGWGNRTGTRNIVIGNAVMATTYGAGGITAQLVSDGITDSISLGNLVGITASNQLAIGSASNFVNHWLTYYSATGVHGQYWRASSPEASQAATRGSIAFVDDSAEGAAYIKALNTTNAGWARLLNVVKEINLTGQNAAITATTLYTVPVDGWYMVIFESKVTTVAGTSSSLGPVQVEFVSAVDGQTVQTPNAQIGNMTNSTANTLTGGYISGSFICHADGGTDIKYIHGYSSNAASAMVYATNWKVIRLNP